MPYVQIGLSSSLYSLVGNLMFLVVNKKKYRRNSDELLSLAFRIFRDQITVLVRYLFAVITVKSLKLTIE